MQKFIIGYGLWEKVDLIDAVDLEGALMVACERSAKNGVVEDPADWSWAHPYSDLAARDLGLIPERRSAPWWS